MHKTERKQTHSFRLASRPREHKQGGKREQGNQVTPPAQSTFSPRSQHCRTLSAPPVLLAAVSTSKFSCWLPLSHCKDPSSNFSTGAAGCWCFSGARDHFNRAPPPPARDTGLTAKPHSQVQKHLGCHSTLPMQTQNRSCVCTLPWKSQPHACPACYAARGTCSALLQPECLLS